MQNIFFFQTQQIPNDTILFNELKRQESFFSYFQVDQNYYLFVYTQQSLNRNLLYQSVEIIQELDSKQRKIRSFRGFFLYALEIMEMGENYEILKTNLQPFFWRKVKNIIRQNKKLALQKFLFVPVNDRGDNFQSSSPFLKDMENKIKTLQKSYDGLGESGASSQAQVDSLAEQVEKLQQKVIYLETLLNNSKYSLSDTLKASRDIKITHSGNSTLEGKKPPYLAENDPKTSTVLRKVRNPTSPTRDIESKSVSYALKIDSKASGITEQYNLPLDTEKGLNHHNFITLANLPQEEKIEIIKTGFQLQAKRTISLKKYYESTEPNSLFQLKRYSIKYETIRRAKLYQTLK